MQANLAINQGLFSSYVLRNTLKTATLRLLSYIVRHVRNFGLIGKCQEGAAVLDKSD
jgi:hypothetical protein